MNISKTPQYRQSWSVRSKVDYDFFLAVDVDGLCLRSMG